MPARYVVGVDGSRRARAARIWAADHASAAGLPLLVVHVDDTPAPRARRHASAGSTSPARDGGTIILHGPIPQALAEFVRTDDVLVIGTGKTGFIHARVYGARGIQIVAAVRSSVAVIPDVDLRFRSGVVVGVDRDETAVLIALSAGAEAAARAEPLLIIHSSFGDAVPAAASPGRSVTLATSAMNERWPELAVRARATTRPAAEALLDAARNAALLVLGPGAGWTGPSIESVTHDVLVNINAPLLIVRPTSPREKGGDSTQAIPP